VRRRTGWLVAAVVVGFISAGLVFAFQNGSCQDALASAGSSCQQAPAPLGVFLGIAGVAFVVFAVTRAFRRSS
jgi:hypothetical protein